MLRQNKRVALVVGVSALIILYIAFAINHRDTKTAPNSGFATPTATLTYPTRLNTLTPSQAKATPKAPKPARTVIVKPDPTVLSPADRERLTRWRATFEHWDTLETFQQTLEDINADRVISKEESAHICFVLDQWKEQRQAAITHVENYRRVEPETVTKNAGLIEGLERESQRALALLNEIECR